MWRGRIPRHGRRDGGRGALLLVMLLRNIANMDRKPPLTLGLIGLMVSIHVRKTLSPAQFKRFSLCPDRVLYKTELSRVVVSAFLHADDVHLYYNMYGCEMISFLWKGYHLEQRFGWLRFGLAVAYLLILCHILVVAFALVLESLGGFHGYLRQCSIGFSGVLFALKVPTKYAAWLELVAIHVLVPRSSFIGHMSGIIAGYTFVLTQSDRSCIEPVAAFLEEQWPTTRRTRPEVRSFRGGTPGDAREERRENETPRARHEASWRSTSVARQRFDAYQREQRPHDLDQQAEITPDELRRRRVARFQDS